MAQELEKQQSEQIELFSYDPIVILQDVVKHWYLILMAALLVGMAAFVGTELTYQPNYTTTTTFVVSNQSDSNTVYQNLSATSSLAPVFSEVLNSSILRQTVLEDLGIASFDGSIYAAAVEETNLITMTVTGRDPRTTFLVTRSIIQNHSVVSYQVLGDTILEVLQEPVVPMAPSNPLAPGHSMKKAALLTAVCMCAALCVLSYLRDTVRSKKEAQDKIGQRVLCELHHERKHQTLKAILHGEKASILITNPATSFSYVEKIRKLRRKVEQHMPEGGKVLMVTSVLENEGKSTIAVNLALSLAQKHGKVLLLDGDLRRPSCYKVLEQAWRGSGTAEVIRGEVSLADSVVPCGKLKKLHLLLDAKDHAESADLLSSDGMRRLLDAVRKEYDFIVVDTPPMAVGADAECMADLADASLLVVRQNAATADMILHGLDILHGAHSKVLGLALNNVYAPVLSEAGSSYGYGYGYGYGHSYGKYGKYGHYGHYGKYGAYGAYHKIQEAGGQVGNDHEK